MKKTILLLIIVLFNNIPITSQNFEWEIVGEMPFPVSRGRAVTLGEKIYILGGYEENLQAPVDWIQEYDPAKNEWKIVGHMLQPRQGFITGTTDTSIVLLGGVEKDSINIYNLEEWIPLIDTQSTVYSSSYNFDRKYTAGNYYNGSFYIFGGLPNSLIDDSLDYKYFSEYNLDSDSFPLSENFIFSNGNFPSEQISILFGDNIYIFGGIFNGILKKIYRYNITNNTFNELTIQLSKPRTGGAAVRNILYEQIYIIGGYDEQNSALSTVDVLKPFPGSESVAVGPELNHARKYLMATFYKGDIYIFGGEDSGGKLVPYVEKLAPNATTIANGLQTLPVDISLKQNYPNPFNPTTVIGYELSKQSFINLKIFDILGNEIKELISDYKQPGYHEVQFNAEDLSSGVYYYQLKAGNFSETKKMVVVK